MGVINLFIGGSGKFVAEEVQGLRRFYNLSLPPSLVFDVNTQATHTGSGSLGHALLAPHASWAGSTQLDVGNRNRRLCVSDRVDTVRHDRAAHYRPSIGGLQE